MHKGPIQVQKEVRTSSPTSYRPRYDEVAEQIQQYVIQSSLKSGERLPTEQQFAERFGVSRSIVREAIKVLSATGLIGVRKGVGLYVLGASSPMARKAINLSMPIEPQSIESLFEFRCIQEMVTARLATTQITLAELRELEKIVQDNLQSAQSGDWDRFLETDDAFHFGIARATHNPFLVETIVSVLDLQRWIIRTITGGFPGSMLQAAQQHETIFRALHASDAEEAAQAMKAHIDRVVDDYHHAIKQWLLGDHDTSMQEDVQ